MKNQIPQNNCFSTDPDYLDTASAGDCTGLIPAGLADEEELENYEELYPFLAKVPSEKDV